MGEMLRLIREHDIKPADVEHVDVGGNHGMTTSLLHHRPTTGLQGKFSMEFCISILMLERKAGLTEYTDAVVQRPDVQEMIRKVNFFVDPEAEEAGLDKMTSLLKIHLKDGRVVSGRAEFAKGSPSESDELRRGRGQISRLRRSSPSGRQQKRRRSSRW